MTGLTQLLYTGASGVMAATEAMQTVSNNTANVNTPGYNVQSVNQVQIPGQPGVPGSGVQVTSIQRSFQQFVYQQLVAAGSASQAAQVNQTSAQTLSALFPVASGGANGLGATLNSFFAAVNTVAQDPTSQPNRQLFLNNAQSLASNFNSLGSQLATNLTDLNNQMTQAVQQINTLAQQIASDNAVIGAQSTGAAGAPNSLLDQRDYLVQQLGQQLGLTLIPQSNGTVDVYTASGDALVNGSSAYHLSTSPGAYGSGAVSIIYGPNGQDMTAALTGGTIGGLLTARSQLISAQDSVGALAVSLADAINTQQTLGLDQNGSLGTALFATAGPMALPDQANTGSAALSAKITSPNAFTPGEFIITNTASGFEAVNTTSGQATALGSGPILNLDGMTITVTGSAAVGDSFLLQPTTQAAAALRVVTSTPAAIAAASPYVATAADTNAGNVTAAAGSPTLSSALPAGTTVIPAAQFGQNLSIQFTSANSFNVLSSSNAVLASGSFNPATGAEIAIAYPASAPAGEVATVTLSPGSAAAGDTFSLTPGGIGSNGNMVAMASLASQNLLSGQTLSSVYAGLVGVVGSNGQAASVASQAAQGVLSQAQTVQQSVSGVNLDEEAAHLVSFEQAYQAAATVIGTAQTLFASLLTAVQMG
ncbi:MAG TPA: flagellar hook-associated protein FlgK [Stellaceae bacterium]|nr:flagellar hook-associated protein FlgK [Stellaceae bacterium]